MARKSFPRGRILSAALLSLLLLAVASARQAEAWTAPSYPGNTLTLAHDGPIVAGTVARVAMSGHAEWNEPTSSTTTPYDLSLYVQNPAVVPSCATSYSAQLQMGINLDLNASSSISGWVMQGELNINPAPPASGIDWSGESLPFSVRPGLGDRVLLCAYQRYVIDDAAGFELPVRVEQPRCEPARHSVKRGRQLTLKCNVSGAVTVRFRGPQARTRKSELATSNGKGTVPTRGLKKGRYRVTVFAGELQLGPTFRFRIR